MKKNTFRVSNSFCVAPWTHTYVSPQGERRLCCASREEPTFQKQYIDKEGETKNNFEPQTLEEHWNSEYMKNIRVKMLNGENVPQCEVCNNKILNIYTYKDYFTKTLFPHKINEIVANTDQETGYTVLKPISFDYRISNICNFKCRMCGEQLSSSWEKEKIKNNMISFETEKWLRPDNREKIKKFQTDILENELRTAVDDKSIYEIYWVGGEPLLFDIHWEIMKKLVETEQSKDVIVRYNTNLSIIKYKNLNLYDLLPHFKNINICASIDGVGEVGEYIRTGLRYKAWLDNFKKGMFLNKLYGDNGIVLDVTITTPGLFHLKQLFDLAIELNVKSYIKLTFAFDPSVIMNPLCLPKRILHEQIDSLLSYIKPKITQKTIIYEEFLLDLKKRKTFEELWPDIFEKEIKKGKQRMELLDKIRKSDNFITFLNKEAQQWWNSI